MSLMHKIRWYHAVLAVTTLLAYFTGDFGFIHDWLGYGVGVIIVLRLGWAVFNPRQLGLNRFYPVFDGIEWTNAITHPAISKTLILAVAVSVILATVTGLLTLIDGGEIFDDFHEGVSSVVIWAVVMHGGYLYLIKRPLARFMLYRDNPTVKDR
ncbi:MAG: cytochrome b/b6 domain-containing protein [Rhodospirillaceae bacterium]|jgi:3-ketosteroid 9alpha-monooxygenase subunit B|nr:cytochrome b/b6 domain-containing protein [Rhodospirillaceae bacterium]MBT6404832.1 cytochrome b/b6 domain-containing protein [Rhodospirillaceae bacterium]MBT6534701.1 cytochrome b/b6 domain-containing protein [Rhodospirillaceae bacterium]MBT7363082.1 cytochrome b/b6 domain-containing protein [Rhodospirillaceae bacterium]